MTVGPAMLTAYRAATTVAAPLVARHLRRRVARGREDPGRLAERFGHATADRPPGDLVWLHAASVGELNAALPLVDRLRGAGHPVLVTSGTVTSAQVAAARLPPGVPHQFVPVDTAAAVRRFFDHWRPAAGILVESEIWPNLIDGAARRAIPLILVNGRMSEKSLRGWQRLAPVARTLFGHFAAVLAQTPTDRDRFRQLGATSATCIGNLKTAAPPPHADADALAEHRAAIAGRPCWLAASTHAGEEAAAAAVHQALAATLPDVLTIIAPRHPDRAPAVAETLRAEGLAVALRSAGDPIANARLYIADTIGEMGLWYRLCPVVFIGNSLPPNAGAHNPIEAINLGAAIVVGPNTASGHFADLIAELTAAGAATVADQPNLAESVLRLLNDTDAHHRQVTAANTVVAEKTAVLDLTMNTLTKILPPVTAT